MLEDLRQRLKRARRSDTARWLRWQLIKAGQRLAPESSNRRGFFEHLYASSDEHVHRPMSKLLRLTEPLITPEQSVLEVGTGAGALLRRLHAQPRPAVLGVDYSVAAVEQLQADGLPAALHDLTSPEPLPRGYDVVCALEVLEHFADPFAIYAKLWAAAERRVVFSVPYKHRVPSPSHLFEFDYEVLVERLSPYGPVAFVGGHPAYIIGYQEKRDAAGATPPGPPTPGPRP